MSKSNYIHLDSLIPIVEQLNRENLTTERKRIQQQLPNSVSGLSLVLISRALNALDPDETDDLFIGQRNIVVGLMQHAPNMHRTEANHE